MSAFNASMEIKMNKISSVFLLIEWLSIEGLLEKNSEYKNIFRVIAKCLCEINAANE